MHRISLISADGQWLFLFQPQALAVLIGQIAVRLGWMKSIGWKICTLQRLRFTTQRKMPHPSNQHWKSEILGIWYTDLPGEKALRELAEEYWTAIEHALPADYRLIDDDFKGKAERLGCSYREWREALWRVKCRRPRGLIQKKLWPGLVSHPDKEHWS